jgi:hypothetical protein
MRSYEFTGMKNEFVRNRFERHAIYFAMSNLLPKYFRSLEDLTNFWLSYQLFSLCWP